MIKLQGQSKIMLEYELKIYEKKIIHKNLLKFYGHYKDTKNHYIVLERVTGCDLEELLEKGAEFWGHDRELTAHYLFK